MTRDDDKRKSDSGEHSAVDPARAESFAKLVDGLFAGDAIPPAMEADDRALLETATMIVASTQELRLSTERGNSIVDEALEQAVTGSPRLSTVPPPQRASTARPDSDSGDNTDVVDLGRRRAERAMRALPWVVATVAAAAALLLLLSRPNDISEDARGAREVAVSEQPAVHQSSRPADALVGRIAPERAEFGSERLDMIYADRMAGYRDLTLSGRRAKGTTP